MCGSEAIRIVGLDFKAGLLLASTFRDLPSSGLARRRRSEGTLHLHLR